MDIACPVSVGFPSESTAPRSFNKDSALARARSSGGSSQESSRQEMPSHSNERTVWLKSTRSTSGISDSCRFDCCFSLHNRMQRPGAVRPARPARWSADAKLIGSGKIEFMPRVLSKEDFLAKPESITIRTPSMVREVSATFVATTTLRRELGKTAASCRSGERSP